MLKILQIIDQLEVGGAEKVLVDMSNILDEHQHDVTVLCLLTPAVLDTHLNTTIKRVYLKRKNKYNPFTLYRLYRQLNTYDVVHVHCRQVMRYVGLLLFLPRFLVKFKVVFHDHYGQIASDKKIDSLLKMQLDRIQAYIGVSNELVSWYQQIFKQKQAYLLSNIVRFTETSVTKSKNPDTCKLVMVGNFRPQKNYEFAINLLAQLPSNYTLTIIGGVVDESYYQKVSNQAQQLQLVNRLTIKTAVTNPRSELVNYDMAIHTATSETGPLVAIEYLSINLPFVMFNTGRVAEQIQPELSDFILSNTDVDLWKERIAYILAHKDSYRTKISSIFRENFSEDIYVQKCQAIYQNL